MAHAYYHAKSSARKFGGIAKDYLTAHEFMDHTKAHVADCRHRLFLHNAWGIFLAEKILGATLARASDGKIVPLRPILEQHVIDDFGFIPTLKYCFGKLPGLPLVNNEDDNIAHSQQSAAAFGGIWSDYLHVHQTLNSSREVLADRRHQRMLHNAWGVTLLLRLLGDTFTRASDGITVSLRPVLEEHIQLAEEYTMLERWEQARHNALMLCGEAAHKVQVNILSVWWDRRARCDYIFKIIINDGSDKLLWYEQFDAPIPPIEEESLPGMLEDEQYLEDQDVSATVEDLSEEFTIDVSPYEEDIPDEDRVEDSSLYEEQYMEYLAEIEQCDDSIDDAYGFPVLNATYVLDRPPSISFPLIYMQEDT